MDLSWMAAGNCDGLDTSLFYPDLYDLAVDYEAAKEVCRACVVRVQCLDYALVHEGHGIWGGTTERERQALRRAAGIRRKPRMRRDSRAA